MATSFVKAALSKVKADTTLANQILYSPDDSYEPNLLVFIPKKECPFTCPFCASELAKTDHYSGENQAYRGRNIFDVEKNILLLTVLYKCKLCGPLLGTDDDILRQSTNHTKFLLTHKSGWSARSIQQIISQLSRGKKTLEYTRNHSI